MLVADTRVCLTLNWAVAPDLQAPDEKFYRPTVGFAQRLGGHLHRPFGCSRATSCQEAAAPPRRAMNCRRLIRISSVTAARCEHGVQYHVGSRQYVKRITCAVRTGGVKFA